METDSKLLREIKKVKWISYSTILLIVITLIVFYFFQKKFENIILSKENELRPLMETEKNLNKDTINFFKIEIYKNRKIEDSLQKRIIRTLDSLELLEGKLRVMQQNSGMTNDVLGGVLDSIDFFRAETESLKQEIKRINEQNLLLLQKERLINSNLQARIKEFEKRLKAIYGINIKVSTYFNGHNADSKLIESSKAKKVNEIKIDFELTRDAESDDAITVEILKGRTKISVVKDVKTIDRTVTIRFVLKPETLEPGKYKIIIYHTNKDYNIEDLPIGESFFQLD